jgi:hypothetical protein
LMCPGYCAEAKAVNINKSGIVRKRRESCLPP